MLDYALKHFEDFFLSTNFFNNSNLESHFSAANCSNEIDNKTETETSSPFSKGDNTKSLEQKF